MRKTTMVIVCMCGLVLAAAPARAEVIRWVPAAASVHGQFGTSWTTDLWIHNMATDEPITVFISLYSSQDGASPTDEVGVEVPPVTPVKIEDVVGGLLGVSRAGALRLRSEHPFEARSRTFNDGGASGSFGQGIPAFDPAESLPFGALVGAANIVGVEGVRTNLGILNPGEEAVDVLVFVFNAADNQTAEFLATFQVDIGPYGWFQSDLFALAGLELEDFDNVYAVVVGDPTVIDPSTPLFSYLSRIDNLSGDAVFIEPFLNLRYSTEAPVATVRYSLETTGGFTPFYLTYSSSGDGDQTVVLPEGDWETEVTLDANRILCFKATGHVPIGSEGSASACMEFEVEGGGSGIACQSCDTEAGELCELEICEFVFGAAP